MPLLFFFLLPFPPSPLLPLANAQPTNEAVFEALAVRCLGEVPPEGPFRLEPPDRLPFVRPALTRHWQAANRTVFLPDTTVSAPGENGRVLLRYAIEEAAVAYARAGWGRTARAVTLTVRYTLTAPDGQVLHENRCHETHTDTLRTADRSRMDSPTYAEAQGVKPEAGPWRRWIEPALLAGTLAVLTYLFFAVRSEGG